MDIKWHFYRESDNVVRVVPRFLFGLAREAVEEMYGPDVDNYPIIGIFTSSTKYDRFIIQGSRNYLTSNAPLLVRIGLDKISLGMIVQWQKTKKVNAFIRAQAFKSFPYLACQPRRYSSGSWAHPPHSVGKSCRHLPPSSISLQFSHDIMAFCSMKLWHTAAYVLNRTFGGTLLCANIWCMKMRTYVKCWIKILYGEMWRIHEQAYMNIVTLSVIFLLWANNPPAAIIGSLQKKKTS